MRNLLIALALLWFTTSALAETSHNFTKPGIQAMFKDIQRSARKKDTKSMLQHFMPEALIEASLPDDFKTNSKQPFLVEEFLESIRGISFSFRLSTVKLLITSYPRPFPKYIYHIKLDDISIGKKLRGARVKNVVFSTIPRGKGRRSHIVYADFLLQNLGGKPVITKISAKYDNKVIL